MTAAQALKGGMLKINIFNIPPFRATDCLLAVLSGGGSYISGILSEILALYLLDRLYLSFVLLVSNTAYLVMFGGCSKLIAICGKFAVVICRIWQTDLKNLEKIAMGNCGPSLMMDEFPLS